MPDFGNAFSGLANDRKLTAEELIRAIRFMVSAEYEAVQLYIQLAESTDNENAAKLLRDIANEEIVHAGEFLTLLNTLAPDEQRLYDDGRDEANKVIGTAERKTAEDMTMADKPTGKNIPGGLAAGHAPAEYPADQLAMGTKVEMEHTNDPVKAKEIAMDHLQEDKEYYSKLKKMEGGGHSKKASGDEEEVGTTPTAEQKKKIRAYIAKTPNLSDETFHEWMEGEGINPHAGEAVVYAYAHELASKSAAVLPPETPVSAPKPKVTAEDVENVKLNDTDPEKAIQAMSGAVGEETSPDTQHGEQTEAVDQTSAIITERGSVKGAKEEMRVMSVHEEILMKVAELLVDGDIDRAVEWYDVLEKDAKPASKDAPGEGGRFKALKKKLSGEKGVEDPGALAAAIGRKKFGKGKFQSMAAKGKKAAALTKLAEYLDKVNG